MNKSSSRFILEWFVFFFTWYTHERLLNVTGRVAALLASCCVAKWIELATVTNCWEWVWPRRVNTKHDGELDARLLGRPPRFTGNEAEWSDWSFHASAYSDTVNPSMADHLHSVETNSERVISLSSHGDVAVENARKMFHALTMLLQGPHLLLLKKVERGNGYEAWRLLMERYEGANASRLHHSYATVHHTPEDGPTRLWKIRGGFERVGTPRTTLGSFGQRHSERCRQVSAPRHGSRWHPSSTDIGWTLELWSSALSDHVIARGLTRLECDGQSHGLHFNANGGGCADTTARQSQRRWQVGEERLEQDAGETGWRQDCQDLPRVRQAGTLREGLLEPSRVIWGKTRWQGIG